MGGGGEMRGGNNEVDESEEGPDGGEDEEVYGVGTPPVGPVVCGIGH